jgi:protein-histidine pros-kinase
MLDFARSIVDTSDFPARWWCGQWSPLHGWTHIVADLAVFGAYFAIPCVLLYFIRKRPDTPFPRIFWLFGAFILACGTGHLIEATIFWHPWYRLSAVVKVATAAVSWATVAALIPILPKAIRMPGLAAVNTQLEQTNATLKAEVAERRRAEVALREAEAHYRSLVESADMILVRVAPTGKFLYTSPQAERISGYTADEQMRDQSIIDRHVYPEDHEKLELLRQTRRELRPESLELEIRYLHPDGSTIWGDVRQVPVTDESGAIVYYDITILNITERKQAEALVRESEQRLRLVFDSAKDYAILTLDPQGRVTSWSLGAERIKGYQASEILGQHFSCFYTDEAVEGGLPEKELQIAAREGRFEDESWRVRKDGSRFWANVVINALKGEDGELIGYSKIVRDLTDRQRLEARFRATVESSLDAVVTIDEQGKVIGWNPQAQTIFGWSYEEIVGRSLAETIIPPAYRDAHRAGLERFLATGEGPMLNQRLELSALRRNGQEFPIELSISPLQIGGGYQFSAYVRDLTERKRAESLFQLAVEAAPNAMLMVDAKGKINLANAAAESMFGFTRKELVGQPVELLVPVDIQDKHTELRKEFFANPQKRQMGVGRDLYGRRKNGSQFPVEIGLSPIETFEGSFVLSAIVDITERKWAECLIIQQKDEMQDFLSIIAHDLKHPIVSIQGLLSILQEESANRLNPEGREYIGLCLDECHRMKEIFSQLGTLARIGRSEIQIEEVDLPDFFQILANRFQELTDRRQAVIEINCPDSKASFAKLQVEEALENLLENALNYGCPKPGAKVGIKCTVNKTSIDIEVSDDGPGVDPMHHTRVFEMFRRLHPEGPVSGSGIGLTAVKRLMKRLNGIVTLESAPGQGAKFTISFPRKPQRGE